MKTIKFLFCALLLVGTLSCDGEDGEDGEDGMDGINGIDGQNATTNIQNLLFDATGFSGDFTDVTVPEITTSVLNNDVILTYLTDDGVFWVPVPTPFHTFQFNFSVHVALSPGFVLLDYGDASGANFNISTGDLQELRVVIIEAGSSGRSSIDGKERILSELAKARVDINNYDEVAAYYNLE